jgi:alcohol dehydrogenase class IV
MAANVRALRERQPGSAALARYDEVGRLLTGGAQAGAADGIVWVEQLCRALAVAPLRAYGLTVADAPAVVAKAAQSSSMKANPVVLTAAELATTLVAAI